MRLGRVAARGSLACRRAPTSWRCCSARTRRARERPRRGKCTRVNRARPNVPRRGGARSVSLATPLAFRKGAPRRPAGFFRRVGAQVTGCHVKRAALCACEAGKVRAGDLEKSARWPGGLGRPRECRASLVVGPLSAAALFRPFWREIAFCLRSRARPCRSPSPRTAVYQPCTNLLRFSSRNCLFSFRARFTSDSCGTHGESCFHSGSPSVLALYPVTSSRFRVRNLYVIFMLLGETIDKLINNSS